MATSIIPSSGSLVVSRCIHKPGAEITRVMILSNRPQILINSYPTPITTGNNASGTTFGWDKNITRGEFVTFLYRAANKPSVVGLTNPFTDVSKAGQPYFYEAILWASKEGITTGRGNGIFDPNANVSYQEVLTFLHRYYVNYLKNTTSGGSLYGFADAGQLAEYAKAPAAWAAGKGIVDYYYDGGLLKPTTAATRGDVALFLHRMLTL